MTQQPPSGWYPDGSGGKRWWNGHQWTDRVAPAPGVTMPAIAAVGSMSAGVKAVRFLKTHPTGRAGWNWTIWALVLLVVIGLVGGQTTHNSKNSSADRPVSTASPVAPTAPLTSSAHTSAANAVTPATGKPPAIHSTAAAALVPSATAGDVLTAAGVVLPDRTRTPGAANPNVTQADIGSTICVSGWTATIRPSSSYTTTLKEQQLASGYAYHGDTNTGDYEEDHLISLELGGSPESELNLWPEPYNTVDGARTKDQIENKLHSLVCAGALSLAAAQHAIATNWWTAYQSDIGTATSNPPTSSAALPPPAPAPTSVSPAGCAPLTSSGNCYTEGEYCRTADRGSYGIAKDGRRIQCVQVDTSWRWKAV